jgi:Fe-Mn family superoxide dismutase
MFSLDQFPLSFARGALAPHMSRETIDFHYGVHMGGYIGNLNSLIAGTEYDGLSLGQIMAKSANDADARKIFNNAAQVFNHDFFFRGLARDSGGAFPREVADAFRGRDNFLKEFKDAAMSVFGSGWAWLSYSGGGALAIETTANADTPAAHGRRPVLALDVWEHAYYLDHRNRRAEFVDAFLAHLVDWDFVAGNIAG